MNNSNETYQDYLALQQAITLWSNGSPIDLCLEIELMNEGLDVLALQATYLK